MGKEPDCAPFNKGKDYSIPKIKIEQIINETPISNIKKLFLKALHYEFLEIFKEPGNNHYEQNIHEIKKQNAFSFFEDKNSFFYSFYCFYFDVNPDSFLTILEKFKKYTKENDVKNINMMRKKYSLRNKLENNFF